MMPGSGSAAAVLLKARRLASVGEKLGNVSRHALEKGSPKIAAEAGLASLKPSHRSYSSYSSYSYGKSNYWWVAGLAAGAAGAAAWNHSQAPAECKAASLALKPLEVDGHKEFDQIVVGGGTAGCVTAYLLAKWMEEQGVEGSVLLIDGGPGYEKADPSMDGWFDNWGSFGKAHESTMVKQGNDGEHTTYPIIPSDHRGLGGCGAHDTRIFYMPTADERKEYARTFGWTEEQFNVYMQAALNLEPTIRASVNGEAYFNKTIEALAKSGLMRLPQDRFSGEVVPDSVAYFDVGAYEHEGGTATRWTSALLINDKADGIRPKRLKVVKGTEVSHINLTPDNLANVDSLVIQQGGEQLQVRLKDGGNVTIAAGSLGTPGILQRSGIGDPEVLRKAGVQVNIPHPEVGHGIDHEEIAVQYEPPTSWPGGVQPRGGVMGWALGIFKRLEGLDRLMQAHFSISGPPYTSEIAVIGTPNNAKPDISKGYRVQISSNDPDTAVNLVYEESAGDKKVLVQGVREMIKLFDVLKGAGLVGERLAPAPAATAGVPAVDINDDQALWAWIHENKGTAYHWLSTCKAGLAGIVNQGSVADEHFRVRMGTDDRKVVGNLFLNSGAVLPFPPSANPHVTIQTFAVAEAWSALKALADRRGLALKEPHELALAREQLKGNEGKLKIRAPGEERPALGRVAQKYEEGYRKAALEMVQKRKYKELVAS